MSQNTYEFQVRAACPVHDGQIDVYAVTVRSSSTIPVEKILEFFAPFTAEKVYQEDLAAKAAIALGASVELVGVHSGVKVRTVAP